MKNRRSASSSQFHPRRRCLNAHLKHCAVITLDPESNGPRVEKCPNSRVVLGEIGVLGSMQVCPRTSLQD